MASSDLSATVNALIRDSGVTLDRLLAIVQAASDLCEEIRSDGTHQCWKQLGSALDAYEEGQQAQRQEGL